MRLLALSHKKIKSHESYFVTDGPQPDGSYFVSFKSPHSPLEYLQTCYSLKDCRFFISKYVIYNLDGDENTIFNQLCKKPLREKDIPDQWKVSQFV
ncbi:hypothetical protein [Peribacillus butanolivorans]|uniref:hypothetical protein n=1 Tax=Peribacillus butanolivorans TaxID=421767 RepID=UPI00381F5884